MRPRRSRCKDGGRAPRPNHYHIVAGEEPSKSERESRRSVPRLSCNSRSRQQRRTTTAGRSGWRTKQHDGSVRAADAKQQFECRRTGLGPAVKIAWLAHWDETGPASAGLFYRPGSGRLSRGKRNPASGSRTETGLLLGRGRSESTQLLHPSPRRREGLASQSRKGLSARSPTLEPRNPVRPTARHAERQAARRLSRLSAIAVNFLSVSFSSSRVCCSTVAQSFRPSSRAQEIRLP
jgi:hypothetical protein